MLNAVSCCFWMSEMFCGMVEERRDAPGSGEKTAFQRRLLELYLKTVNTIAQKRIMLLPKKTIALLKCESYCLLYREDYY